jgi:3-methyladenine DNA glycosylase AlkD
MKYQDINRELKGMASPEIAEHSQRFFKTGKGEYGEGDRFLGIRVPELRKLAKKYQSLSMSEVEKLVVSSWHEQRLTGLLIMVLQYESARKKEPAKASRIYRKYISLYRNVNGWDLVDVTCPKIMGPELYESDRKILFTWAKSSNLWKKRMSIMTTLYFIKQGDLEDTYKLAKTLLNDEHDLIHKAVGWMLRETGKVSRKDLNAFLDKYATKMPRTMLRYALEKHPETQRKRYMKIT